VNAVSTELVEALARPEPPGPTILDLPHHGIHENVPGAQYYAKVMGVASNSILTKFARAEVVYHQWVTGQLPDESTKALDFGVAVHMAVLEPDEFARRYAAEPDFGYCVAHQGSGTTKDQGAENKRRRDAWRAEHAGAIRLDEADARAIAGMRESLMRHPLVRTMVERGRRELTVRWEDPDTEIVCKSRLDTWLESISLIGDLKSTVDARPGPLARSVEKYGYARQAAFYPQGVHAVTGTHQRFAMVACEKKPPYLSAVYTLTPEALRIGQHECRVLLRRFRRCIDRGVWRGLPEGITELALRPWYEPEMDDEENEDL
jgi:exodeoxyribonuclease VIII